MDLENEIQTALYDVIDPELGINIVDLGLVYGISLDEENNALIAMTLTTPGCPMHDSITKGVEHRLKSIEGLGVIKVNLVWEPAWTPENMSEKAMQILWGN
ncbi:metal-sulfur cluster assembly factor [Paucisalibacillus globulus]|uniref:metal-sulfur cluster assembly factor n=1 Tax=Paucisalibacillus globulus TaxID=351095 RepID=UPI0004185306|nr:iron-sulfur cluster assembly protein [Paucisalibacillus globulus]